MKLGFRVFRDFEKKNSPLCACEIYAYSYHVIKSAALCARSLSIVSFVELALDGRRPVVPIEVFVLHGL